MIHMQSKESLLYPTCNVVRGISMAKMNKMVILHLILCIVICFINVDGQPLEALHCIVEPPCECQLDNPDVAEQESVNAVSCAKQHLLKVPLLNITDGTRKFQKIDFSSNSLNSIPDDYFTEVAGLEDINLDKNAFVSVPEAVRSLRGLKRLSLRENRLSLVPSSESQFVGLSSLEYLDLQSNTIGKLYSGCFMGLNSLETLRLANNEISIIDKDVWEDLPCIRHLDLNNNFLRKINDTCFRGLYSLNTLNMTTNYMVYITPGSFQDMGNLTILDLSANSLQRYLQHNLFSGLRNLAFLNLFLNHIDGLEPDIFDSLTILESIDLTRNKMKEISINSFGRSSYSLKSLRLGLNLFVNFSQGFFDNFPSLKTLSLLGLIITEVPDIRGLSKLETLSFSYTGITDIYPCDLEGLQNLTTMYWANSKINCNCQASWLKTWYETMLSKSHRTLIESSSRLYWKCNSPPSLLGKAFHLVDASNLTCAGHKEPKWCHGKYQSALFTVKLSINEKEGPSLQLKWNISSNMIPRVEKIHVVVSSDMEGSVEEKTIRYNVSTNETYFELIDLTPNTLYNICLILSQDNGIQLARDCVNRYSPKFEGKTISSLDGIIMGSVISGLVLVITCACVLFFICRKLRRIQGRNKRSDNTNGVIYEESREVLPNGIVLFDPSKDEAILGVDA